MKLNKRYSRSIKGSVSFYVSASLLTMLTLILFFIMNTAGTAIKNFGEDFFDSQKIEDANFATYMPISDEEIEKLEEKYSITLEPQYYKNIDTNGVTTRLFKKTEKLNLYNITEGADATKDNEVIISEGYAVHNKIDIGDDIKIGEKTYTITGFFQRPDYLYMLQNDTDPYMNVTTFFLAYMTDDAFSAAGNSNCQYAVSYETDNNIEFRREINEKYVMRSYVPAKENMRIDMVDMQSEMFITFSYVLLAVMPLIVVILVSVVINRKVKSEQKMIGTLTALGYKKGRLMLHYAGFAIIPGLLGGIIATIISIVFAQPFGELCLADYEPMRINCSVNPVAAIIGIVIPVIMYTLAAMFSVNRLLKTETVLLLNDNADQDKKNFKKVLVKKKISFRFKYAVRSLIGNPVRTFVVFFGVFIGSFIALFSFSILDTMDNTKNNMVDEMGSFEYQYVLNELIETNEYGGESLLMSTGENKSGDRFSIIGTTDDNPYLDMRDIKGNKINLENGYYITNVMATLQELEEGDQFTVFNPLTLEEITIEIAGIIDNDMQNALFCSRKNASALLDLDDKLSNVIMSDKELAIPESKIMQVIKKSDTKEQIQNVTEQMGVMIYFLIGIGAAICLAAIYIAVNMLVMENRSNISMLKVLGYKDKKINNIVLRVNHILLPIGIACSVPLVLATTKMCMSFLAEYMNAVPKAYISPKSYVLTALITAFSYFGSLLLLRRKVSKIDMVLSLKGNRE